MPEKKRQFLDMPEWFEQAISGRIDDACSLCEKHSRDIYEEFIARLREIILPDDPRYYDIEDLFNSQVRRAAEAVYPMGVYDGITLLNSFKR